MEKAEKTGIREQVLNEIIDLAVYGGNFDRFALDVNEETSTLLQFDIVDADRKMQPELLESMEKEGVVLYEKI